MMTKRMNLSVTYGSWRVDAATHILSDDGKKLCDNRRTQYGFGLGRAGNLESVTCKRCKKKLEELSKDKDIIIVDGWTGVERE